MEEQKIPERYLPIGTVVMLKKGRTPVMITSFCVYPKENKGSIYDYGACPYPQGILNPDVVHAFNHDRIEKILHMGYETDDSKKMSELLNKGIDAYKEKVAKESAEQSKKAQPKADDKK